MGGERKCVFRFFFAFFNFGQNYFLQGFFACFFLRFLCRFFQVSMSPPPPGVRWGVSIGAKTNVQRGVPPEVVRQSPQGPAPEGVQPSNPQPEVKVSAPVPFNVCLVFGDVNGV